VQTCIIIIFVCRDNVVARMYINRVLMYARCNAYCVRAGKRVIIGILCIGKDCVVAADEGRVVQTAIVTLVQDTRDSRLGGQESRRRVTFADRLLAGERERISPTLTHRAVVCHRKFFSVAILMELNFKRT
jgi:hypothetical protein